MEKIKQTMHFAAQSLIFFHMLINKKVKDDEQLNKKYEQGKKKSTK